MAISLKSLGFVLAGILLAVGLGVVGVFLLRPADSRAIEISVLFPRTSDQSWSDFVAGIRLAAGERGLVSRQGAEPLEWWVETKPVPVVFRWYPERGLAGIRQRVGELGRQRRPPLALVGANNSSLTRALAEALAESTDREGPLLLMTTATADDLISITPGRAFRFGYSNSYQARTVVERLVRRYQERGTPEPRVKVMIAAVLEDPFSVDLARRFQDELARRLQAEFVGPPPGFAVAGAGGPALPAPAWTLATSTGDFENPNQEEWDLARRAAQTMLADPHTDWVLVFPFGTIQYRRLCLALDQVLSDADPAQSRSLMEKLVILAGDSLSYDDFRVPELRPDDVPAPIIFFEHTNPLDRSVSSTPHPRIGAQGLDREVVRTLLAVLPQLGPDPQPSALAAALAAHVPPGRQAPLFRDHERHEGGGAVIAIPEPQARRFDILLPEPWEPAE